jgi:hypothetical protein
MNWSEFETQPKNTSATTREASSLLLANRCLASGGSYNPVATHRNSRYTWRL